MNNIEKWVNYDPWHFLKSGKIPNKLLDKEMVNINVTSNYIKEEFEKAIEDRVESLGLRKQVALYNHQNLDMSHNIERRIDELLTKPCTYGKLETLSPSDIDNILKDE